MHRGDICKRVSELDKPVIFRLKQSRRICLALTDNCNRGETIR